MLLLVSTWMKWFVAGRSRSIDSSRTVKPLDRSSAAVITHLLAKSQPVIRDRPEAMDKLKLLNKSSASDAKILGPSVNKSLARDSRPAGLSLNQSLSVSVMQ